MIVAYNRGMDNLRRFLVTVLIGCGVWFLYEAVLTLREIRQSVEFSAVEIRATREDLAREVGQIRLGAFREISGLRVDVSRLVNAV